jgi:ADP-ribosyl-[dinitrogen reductase] hydrolase
MEGVGHYRGALLGLATGDALGAPVEGMPLGTFAPVEDIIGGGIHRIKPGYWTDNTSMALCLAESLIEKRGFDSIDQLGRYLRWFREGYFSCRGSASA